MTALPPFANEPVLELRRATERSKLAVALGELRLGLRVPVWIGDERRHGDELVSTDPGDPERVVALAASATAEEAVVGHGVRDRAQVVRGDRDAHRRPGIE